MEEKVPGGDNNNYSKYLLRSGRVNLYTLYIGNNFTNYVNNDTFTNMMKLFPKFSEPELLQRANRFSLIERDPIKGNEAINIEKKQQQDGTYKYAITNGSSVLTKEGDFEFEPPYSSRDNEYFKRARFSSLEAALSYWNEWIQTQQNLPTKEQSPYFRNLIKQLSNNST